MRLILACCGIVGMLTASGHGPSDGTAPEQRARAPLWISLPRSAMIDTIERTGVDSGIVNVSFDHAASAELTVMKERLALRGYEISENLNASSVYAGVSSYSRADDPTTGRSVKIYEMQRPAGDAWRVAYADPTQLVATLIQ